MVSAVTLYETMLVMRARRGPECLEDLEQLLATAEIQIVPFNEVRAYEAYTAYMRFGKEFIQPPD
jgi:uncharacterized protein with PIN domain